MTGDAQREEGKGFRKLLDPRECRCGPKYPRGDADPTFPQVRSGEDSSRGEWTDPSLGTLRAASRDGISRGDSKQKSQSHIHVFSK